MTISYQKFVQNSRMVQSLIVAGLIDKKEVENLGKKIVTQMIVPRTRLGFDKDRKKFKPLRPNTVNYRTWYSKRFGLFTGSTPKRSHLTLTGHMLDSLYSKADNEKTITILFADEFSKKKMKWNRTLGRDFFGFTDSEMERILEGIQDLYDSAVLKALTV